ncbi:MAG: hypothetical protein R2750_11190 [Bacteroidales bacterium]
MDYFFVNYTLFRIFLKKQKHRNSFGLAMYKLIQEKEYFLKNLVPKWDEEAKKREEGYEISYK